MKNNYANTHSFGRPHHFWRCFRLLSAGLAQPIPGQYIAVLKGDVPNPANAAQELAGQHGVNVRHIYEHSIHGFAFEGNEKAAQALARNPKIAYVEQDQLCQAWAILNSQRASCGSALIRRSWAKSHPVAKMSRPALPSSIPGLHLIRI